MDEQNENHVINAQRSLRNRMDELHSKAEEIGKRYLEYVLTGNRTRDWKDKSVLYVKPRLRDNTLAATWYVVSWYGSKVQNTRRMMKKVIVKPKRKYGYNIETLLKQAQPWEVDMVREVESELIPLRREAVFVGEALGKLNQVLRNANE